MTPVGDPLERTVASCLELTVGVRAAALEPRALGFAVRALRASGASDSELTARCTARAPDVLDVLASALTVNETFFFRSPAQFELIESTIVPRLLASGQRRIEAWSAGCADGAEAYSLAACLRACAPPDVQVSVLGTDIARERIEFARRGSYGVLDLRSSGPLLFPALMRSGEALVVTPEVKALVEFRVHNLLDEPPRSASFDLVLCRNVLVYLTLEARQRVSANLRAALAPRGVLITAPADPLLPGPGVVPLGGPENAAFVLAPSALLGTVSVRPSRSAEVVAESARAPSLHPVSPCVALHLQALAHIDDGDDTAASRLLHRLLALDPDYIPGLTELALLENRGHRFGEAHKLMARVLDSTEPLPVDALVQGPRPLPVSFYRESALAFSRRGARV